MFEFMGACVLDLCNAMLDAEGETSGSVAHDISPGRALCGERLFGDR
jgi:hypothetical protein